MTPMVTPIISPMMFRLTLLDVLSTATSVAVMIMRAAWTLSLTRSIPMNQVVSKATVLETVMPEFVHNLGYSQGENYVLQADM